MPDTTVRIAPLAVAAADLVFGPGPYAGSGVTLTVDAPTARYSLRARDGAALGAAIGRALPARIGETAGGIAKLGPDEWLAVLPAGTTLPEAGAVPASVVDVSSRAVGVTVSGPRAQAVIATGCPLDLDAYAVGRASRTVFETVEMVLWREAADRFRVECWRSFSPWLWNALIAACE